MASPQLVTDTTACLSAAVAERLGVTVVPLHVTVSGRGTVKAREITPAEVMDTATFYEEYWLRPKGKYLVQVCRSLSCEICQSSKLTEHVQKKLLGENARRLYGIDPVLVEVPAVGRSKQSPSSPLRVRHRSATLPSLPEPSEIV